MTGEGLVDRRRVSWPLSCLVGIICALAFPLATVLYWASEPDDTWGDLLIVAAWYVAAVIGLGLAIWSAIVKRYARAAAFAMLPLSLAISLANYRVFHDGTMVAGEYLDYRMNRGRYLAEIAAMPADRGARTKVFVLSEDGWAGISNWHLLVYDESGEIARPQAEWSADWKAKIADTPLEYGVGFIAPIGDNFYIVAISN
jgi:hypothetical protein